MMTDDAGASACNNAPHVLMVWPACTLFANFGHQHWQWRHELFSCMWRLACRRLSAFACRVGGAYAAAVSCVNSVQLPS
jgi:hypothetical protein